MSAAWRNLAVGIASGLAAAWVRDAFQKGCSSTRNSVEQDDSAQQASGRKSEPATVKADDRVSNVVQADRSPGRTAILLDRPYFPSARTAAGMLYRAAVWLVADEFLVPAGELTPPPREVPASTHIYAFVSHLVFGAALEGSRRGIETALRMANRRKLEA